MRDALGRRKRYDGSEPTGARVILTDRDITWMLALQTHGMLPSHYLHGFGGGSIKGTAQRLTVIHHEGGYLARPEQQRHTDRARYQALTYQLAPKAEALLHRRGLSTRHTASFRGHTAHQFMVSCLTASMELACREAGLRYISQEDIFRDVRCMRKSLSLPCQGTEIVPDQLFGIGYGDGKARFFAVEAERAEKSMTRYEEKLRPYDAILGDRIYRTAWGIPNLRVLVFTASEARITAMMEPLDHCLRADQFLFRAKPHFAGAWEVPPVMTDLLHEPWQTTKGMFFINRP